MSESGADTPRRLRVAIIGSGPSGFYSAQHLQNNKELQEAGVELQIDMFDRLPVPFGLVRYGVAPDHQKVKSVTKAYTKVATKPGFRFLGGVELGRDLSRDEFLQHYSAVIYSVGAQTDRRLRIPGEDLDGHYPATAFVAWYNGHPDYRHMQFDLSHERAIVVGVGNVAVDVARILCRSRSELEKTDIADYALEALSLSQVKEVILLGRRGPAQAAFTNTEVKELADLEITNVRTKAHEVALDSATSQQLAAAPNSTAEQKVKILQSFAEEPEIEKQRTLWIRFLWSPQELYGDGGHVQRMRLSRNELFLDDDDVLRSRPTEEIEDIEAGLVFRSVGYRGKPIEGLPFRDDWSVIPHRSGRVLESVDGAVCRREYVAGWIKRGPSGVIGTNKPDALETVQSLVSDALSAGGTFPVGSDPSTVDALLAERKVDVFDFDDWLQLDALEVERGQQRGSPRVKFTSAEEMRAALEGP